MVCQRLLHAELSSGLYASTRPNHRHDLHRCIILVDGNGRTNHLDQHLLCETSQCIEGGHAGTRDGTGLPLRLIAACVLQCRRPWWGLVC